MNILYVYGEGFASIQGGREDEILRILAHYHPISVRIACPNSLQHYKRVNDFFLTCKYKIAIQLYALSFLFEIAIQLYALWDDRVHYAFKRQNLLLLSRHRIPVGGPYREVQA